MCLLLLEGRETQNLASLPAHAIIVLTQIIIPANIVFHFIICYTPLLRTTAVIFSSASATVLPLHILQYMYIKCMTAARNKDEALLNYD